MHAFKLRCLVEHNNPLYLNVKMRFFLIPLSFYHPPSILVGAAPIKPRPGTGHRAHARDPNWGAHSLLRAGQDGIDLPSLRGLQKQHRAEELQRHDRGVLHMSMSYPEGI